MKQLRFVRVGVGGLVLAAALAGCTNYISGADSDERAVMAAPVALVPGTLVAAHQAYLDGDFLGFGELIRDVLLDPNSSDLVKQNAFELFDKANAVRGGKLPSTFKPPESIRWLQYGCRRFTSPHGPYYQIRFAGRTRDASRLVGLTVRRLPDQTLMDKQSGKGRFGVRHDPVSSRGGFEEFVIDSEPMDEPPADGVISLRFELDDGTVSEGFIIARGLTPPASPELVSPAAWASVAEANPLVRWIPPSVSQGPPFEGRRMGIHVRREGVETSLWEFATKSPFDLNEVRIGSSAGVGATTLSPGNYWIDLSAVESRYFGPVEVFRGSRTSRPFHVALP